MHRRERWCPSLCTSPFTHVRARPHLVARQRSQVADLHLRGVCLQHLAALSEHTVCCMQQSSSVQARSVLDRACACAPAGPEQHSASLHVHAFPAPTSSSSTCN